jgi:hypothetical protein
MTKESLSKSGARGEVLRDLADLGGLAAVGCGVAADEA